MRNWLRDEARSIGKTGVGGDRALLLRKIEIEKEIWYSVSRASPDREKRTARNLCECVVALYVVYSIVIYKKLFRHQIEFFYQL